MYKRTRWGFFFLTIIIAFSLWVLSVTPIQFGIDLFGGTELTYRLDLSKIETGRNQVAEEVKNIISNRLNSYGLKEISVSVQGEDQLVVQLPGQGGQQSVENLKRQVETAGQLEFRLVATTEEQTPERQAQYENDEREFDVKLSQWIANRERDPSIAADSRPPPPRFIVRELVEKDETKPNEGFQPTGQRHTLSNNPNGIVSGRFLARVGPTVDPQSFAPAVAFEFTGDGARMFGDLTGANKDRLLAITLDNDVMQVATIKDRITQRGQLSGSFTDADVQGIVTILRGGSLPTKPELLSETSVGSVLGQDAIASSLQAMVSALVCVAGIMATYYLAAGLVTNFALVLNIFFLLTYVACFRQTLTLPGVAGILLTVGMAVDANILIFERVREEKKKGKSLLQSLTTGYQRAFWVIFDANLTTLITGFVLFYFGTGPVKGFAITLISGIAISFITAIFVTRLIISFFLNAGVLKELKMLEAFDTPKIGFVKRQKVFLIASMVVIALTWVLVVWRGKENYGIDFTGGTRINMQLKKPVSVDEMKNTLADLQKDYPELFNDYSLQTLRIDETTDGLASSFALRTRTSRKIGKVADAQENPAAGTTLPTGEGTPSDGTPPGGGSPGQPEGSPPAPELGAATTDTSPEFDELEDRLDPAEQVRRVLEKALSKEDLLLPPLFPTEEWRQAEGVGNEAKQYLVLEANLINVKPTLEALKASINEAFAENVMLRAPTEPAADGSYDGVRVERVELKGKPGDDGVSRYEFVTNAYVAPLAALRSSLVPTHSQVMEAFQGYFHSHGPGALATGNESLFELSDPFPEVSTVGPRVATNLQLDAIVALFISVLGIIFYISLRFEFTFGLAAIVALFHDILITIGVVAIVDQVFGATFPIKINLPELAALLTIIGYSINDTIVVFDRIRENLQIFAKKRVPFADIVDLSINQTLTRTLWTSITTLIVILVLLFFATESVRGFAFIFAIGIVTGTYSSVFVASPVLISLQKRAVARREAIAAAAQ